MPGSGRDPISVQNSAGMKEYRPVPSSKPDKYSIHINTLCDRNFPLIARNNEHREFIRKKLRILLFSSYGRKAIVEFLLFVLKYIKHFLERLKQLVLAIPSSAGSGGTSAGDHENTGRGPSDCSILSLSFKNRCLHSLLSGKNRLPECHTSPFANKRVKELKMTLEKDTRTAHEELKKSTAWQKAKAIALSIPLALGLISTQANADDLNRWNQKGTAYHDIKTNDGVHGVTKDGKKVLLHPSGEITSEDGRFLGHIERNQPHYSPPIPNPHIPPNPQSTYQQKIQELDKRIQQDPTNAKPVAKYSWNVPYMKKIVGQFLEKKQFADLVKYLKSHIDTLRDRYDVILPSSKDRAEIYNYYAIGLENIGKKADAKKYYEYAFNLTGDISYKHRADKIK